MTWCRKLRSESKHPNVKVGKDWDLDLQNTDLTDAGSISGLGIFYQILYTFRWWQIWVQDSRASGSHLPSSVWALLLQLCQHCQHKHRSCQLYWQKNVAFSIYTEIWSAFISVAMAAEAALAHLTLALAFLSCQCNHLWPYIDPEERLKITLLSEHF